MLVSTIGFLLASGPVALALLAAAYGAGQQTFFVVQNPFLAERSRPDQRSELFALVFAIENVTNIVAAVARWGDRRGRRERGRLRRPGPGGVPGHPRPDGRPDDPGRRRDVPHLATTGRGAGGPPTGSARWASRRRSRPRPTEPRPAARARALAADPRPADLRPPAPAGLPHRARRRPGHPVPQPVHPGQVRAGPRPRSTWSSRSPRWARWSRSSSSRPSPAGSARSARWSWSRAASIPFLVVLGLLADPLDGRHRDGRPELAHERRQPDLQRVRDGAGGARRAGDARRPR